MSYHSSLVKSDNGSQTEGEPQPSENQGTNYFQFSGSDWSSAQVSCCARLQPLAQDCEIVDEAQKYQYEFAEDDLKNAKSTAARLTALEKIAQSGTDSFVFEDADGAKRQFRVETSKCGDKTLIHCYANDADGNEQIVMRMVRNASGELEQEKDKEGKPVSYYGDNWSRNMYGKSVLTGESKSDHYSDHQAATMPGKGKHECKTVGERGEREYHKDSRDHRRRDLSSLGEHDGNRDRGREHNSRLGNGESSREPEQRLGLRLDMGRTLADLAMVAAPILMAQMNNGNRCHDYYPYQNYSDKLQERQCRNYYEGYGADYPSTCGGNYGQSRGYQNFRYQSPGFCR